MTILLLLTAACTDAPVPVHQAGGHQAGGGEALPPEHQHVEAEAELAPAPDGFGGRATLVGELARAESGALVVSVFTTGSNMPHMTYRVDMDGPEVSRGVDELHFDFRLDPTTSMIPGSVPDDIPLELEVRYDVDGFVETVEGDVTVRVPAELGDDGLELTLSRDS